MHPLTRALLSSWEWRPDVIVVLSALAILYGVGWLRLRRQSVHGKVATRWRLTAYMSGLAILATSLMSPIDRLGGDLFFMHMIQHMLVIQLVAPLLLLGNPFPFVLWALPTGPRLRIARLFTDESAFRRALAAVTRPGIAWLVFLTVYLGWHDTAAYNAALTHKWVHNLQHITFLLASMLYWWPIVGNAPHIHRKLPAWVKIPYLIGVIPPNMIVGVSIAFAEEILYSYYLTVPRIWGFTAIQDQQLAGAIMWIQGSDMYIWPALYILFRMFRRKPAPKPRTGQAHPQWNKLAGPTAPDAHNPS